MVQSTSALAEVEFNIAEVQDTSLDLMRVMEEDGVTIGVAVASMSLAIGRLMSPDVLSEEKEIKFVQDILEWASMYFVPGGIN